MKKTKDLKAEDTAGVAYDPVDNLTGAGFDKQKADAIANEQLALVRRHLRTLLTREEFAKFEAVTQKEFDKFELALKENRAQWKEELDKFESAMKEALTG